MFTLSVAVEVNPAGAAPALTAHQVWRGLVMKAENGALFVPRMQACEVLERDATGLLREIAIGEERFREKITFTPEVEVLFERVGNEANAGWITNVISESALGLLLTFTFAVNLPGVTPGSAQERERGLAMRRSYVGAVEATLRRVRELVAAGKI
jgi:Acetylaranotin biosynthesis cluster protein L